MNDFDVMWNLSITLQRLRLCEEDSIRMTEAYLKEWARIKDDQR